MIAVRKTRYTLLLLVVATFLSSFYAEAQRVRGKRNRTAGTERTDTIAADSLAADTLAADTAAKRQPLEAPVTYEASDSIVFTKGGFAFLYGEGKVNYQNIERTSALITMNMDSSVV